jgi:putative flippase GtrA
VDWYIKKTEAMRYLVFGGLCTVLNIAVFALFNALELPTLSSNTIAWIISVLFAYITNKYCVFDAKTSSQKDLLREFVSFITARLATLGVETIMMWVTVDLWHWNAVLMKVIANIVVIILNFVFSKLFIFKDSKEAEIIDSLDD